MASWHPDNTDEHECGQLRIAVAGEQVSLLPLPDETIPTTDEPQAVDELLPLPDAWRKAIAASKRA